MVPSHSSLLLFVGAALVLLAIPGPAVFYVTSRSIGHGRGAGLVSALGIGVGKPALGARPALRFRRNADLPRRRHRLRRLNQPEVAPVSHSTRHA
jgi:hypothetical protein